MEGTGPRVIPGAGHAAHLERPEVFAGLEERFLDRAFPPAGGTPPTPGPGTP